MRRPLSTARIVTTVGVLTAGMAAAAVSVAAPSGAAPSPMSRAAALGEARSDVGATAQRLGLASGEKLVVKDAVVDRSGARHERYTRTFDGLRVVGGDLVVHRTPGGAIASVSRSGPTSVAVASVTPQLSRSAARTKANAQRIALKQPTSTPGQLVVFAGGATPRLAYDVVTRGIKADQTPSVLHTVVDADTGRRLTSWDEVVTGTGSGIFVGSVSLGTTSGTGGYTLRDQHGNYTTDLGNRTSGSGTTFTDADDLWGNGSNSDRASAGVDAHYGAEKTYEFYDSVLGRAGIWDDGTGARSRVHYGNNYVNAFWDGTQMTYGDGAGNNAPLVELDVAGHEMSHGVTENTAGLNYSGDAGGLNEATSDIFGTAVEWYANNASDSPDFLIGEEIDINGDGTPLRYMDRPSRDGASQDCWTTGTKNLDPHYSSGPLNHWYFLASNGSGARTINGVAYDSPTCNGASITGIGHETVEKIWYRTLSVYLTSGSDYTDARDGAITSAKDLYGAGSTQCTAVQASFDAISVPAGSASC
ncbi:M4 family metallopeptidase [Jatrophihabitans fulvus]